MDYCVHFRFYIHHHDDKDVETLDSRNQKWRYKSILIVLSSALTTLSDDEICVSHKRWEMFGNKRFLRHQEQVIDLFAFLNANENTESWFTRTVCITSDQTFQKMSVSSAVL